MSRELWATYSVTDHLNPRALAADILLFDRLVFPVPETACFPENSGPPDVPGPVKWTKDATEWARWENKIWEPERQRQLLKLLQPVIRKVSWGKAKREWRAEAARLAAAELPDYAYVATRTVLTRDLPAYVTGVSAVGPAYRTVEEMERELGIGETGRRKQMSRGALATVLGWEFLSPEDDRLSDEELLKETVEFVTHDDEFKRSRRDFIDWQEKFLKNGATDRESIERAREEMRELLEQTKKAASNLKLKKITQNAFRIAPAALGLTMAIAGIPDGVAVAAGGAFLSAVEIAADNWLAKNAEGGQPEPTAFVHHVNRHFGWK